MNEKLRVLLVEDNEVFNYLSKRALENLDFDIELSTTMDGDEALEHIQRSGCPDLIFLDVKMPRMNGFEFLEAFSEIPDNGHTRIFMLTSTIRTEDKKMAMQHKNVVGYLEKPLNKEKVQQVVSTLIKRAS